MKLFGWQITKAGEDTDDNLPVPSFSLPEDAGVATIPVTGGMQSFAMDFEGGIKTEADLIIRYREMALQPEIDTAVDDIVNESVITDDINNPPVVLNLDGLEVSDNIKEVIQQEFDKILAMLKFSTKGYEIYRQWYIDGRQYYYLLIDPENPQNGIQEMREVDALKLRKVREVNKNNVAGDGHNIQSVVNEYYLYSSDGFSQGRQSELGSTPSIQKTRIPTDAIIYVTSGLTDKLSNKVLSHLHPAIKPLNMLRSEETAAVIYKLVRAPERRIFNVEVGGLPAGKATQYINDMMTKYKNKVTFDESTGTVTDARRFMTMTDDFWLPKRNGEGTTIDTLPGGDMDNVTGLEYFKRALQESLKVPLSRLNPDVGFSLGRATEMTRDELKFMKFIGRLQTQFSHLFSTALHRQLVLRQIIAPEEWEMFAPYIKFVFTSDSYLEESKNSEIMRDRAQTMNIIRPYIGTLFTNRWAAKNIWQMNDEQYDEMQGELAQDIQANPNAYPQFADQQ